MKDFFLVLTICTGVILLIDVLVFSEAPAFYYNDKVLFAICAATYTILRRLDKGK